MHYPTPQDVERIVAEISKQDKTKITIINRGQLEFALEKPRMHVYGHEQYPELYQKAATVMEVLTKSHVLSDGNKRCAMRVARTYDLIQWITTCITSKSHPVVCGHGNG